MNAIVESILQEQVDFILPKMQTKHDLIADRARKWLAAKDNLLPVLQAFRVIGANVSVDANCCIDVSIAGDKECFIKCWKLWRSVGIRLTPATKGATEISEFIEPFQVRCWFRFCSTVCKRVQVGVQMVQQPIYETQCGTDLSEIKQEALEDNSVELLPAPSALSANFDDDIPF